MKKSHNWLDGMAIAASFLCLLHCLALPLMLAFLPAFAALTGISEAMHLGILLFAVPTSLLALVPVARRTKSRRNLLIGIGGIALLAFGLAFEEAGTAGVLFTVAGSLCLALAHLFNWRIRHKLPFEQ